MNIEILDDANLLGVHAARRASEIINKAIHERGMANIILSTGASQFTTLQALLEEDIDWSKVAMFHLDEYIGIDTNHSASFVKYLKDRFVSKVDLKEVYFVDPSNGVESIIEYLTRVLESREIDCALIGIGENSHIAFNDPPADFDTTDTFKVVELDSGCRQQQFGEGWFPTIDDVPTHAITMTVHQIMKSKSIITAVPYAVKSKAVKDTLTNSLTPLIPSTMLKEHKNLYLYLDKESSSELTPEILSQY